MPGKKKYIYVVLRIEEVPYLWGFYEDIMGVDKVFTDGKKAADYVKERNARAEKYPSMYRRRLVKREISQ